MKFIAHRGNISGKTTLENSPIQITAAIQYGYDAEVDVWIQNNTIYLGHDYPVYEIGLDFLTKFSRHLWIHCKNASALEFFNQNNNFNYFWHQEDHYTLTSKGFVWIYPNLPLAGENSVIVMPETCSYKSDDIFSAYAICSDHVDYYKLLFDNKGIENE
jgi:hypothetical protein